MKNRFSLRSIWAVAIVAAIGCGGDSSQAEVSGRVTLDGNPVGPGTIVFAPVGGGGNPATGTIQVDGSYVLMSNRTPGLSAGAYQTSVTVFDQPPTAPGERSTAPAKMITPEKYADPSTSGLQYEVTPGSQTIDVPLTSK